LRELRWSRTMLASPRAVREISRSSILAEQTRLIALGRAVTVLIRHLEELYQPAPLRSGPSSSRAVSLHRVAAAMVVTLAAGLLPRLAQAQAVVADGPGTTLPATGTIITLPGTTALHALNGGTITGTPPLTVNTRGGAQAVLADSGGMINITGSRLPRSPRSSLGSRRTASARQQQCRISQLRPPARERRGATTTALWRLTGVCLI
jgi:hypothetical protein